MRNDDGRSNLVTEWMVQVKFKTKMERERSIKEMSRLKAQTRNREWDHPGRWDGHEKAQGKCWAGGRDVCILGRELIQVVGVDSESVDSETRRDAQMGS